MQQKELFVSDFVIDPTQFPHADPIFTELLIALLNKSGSPFMPHGEYSLELENKSITVELTHSLLKRSRERKSDEYRIEIFEHEKSINGGFSELFKSLGVLVPELNYTFKSKPKDKSRVCKIILITEDFTQPMIIQEGSYTRMNQLLHCKMPVIDRTHGYLVMRNAGETDLHELLCDLFDGDLNLTILQKLLLTRAILKAIKEQIHDLGLMHRDIKPENIMIDLHTMSVIIIDYAFARKTDMPYESQSIYGSLSYLAPETLYNNTRTIKSDIFAAGLTIAELWGDRSTYPIRSGDDHLALYEFHRTRTWVDLFEEDMLSEQIKTKLTRIFDDLTRFDPEHRGTIEEALRNLDDLIAEYMQMEELQKTSTSPDESISSISGRSSVFFQKKQNLTNESSAKTEEGEPVHTTGSPYPMWRRDTV